MIFGRYTPAGAVTAALLFGFTTQLQSILSSINVPIQSNLLLLTPYVVTILVVAGLVGKVRGPRAEGVPYLKSLPSYPSQLRELRSAGGCRRMASAGLTSRRRVGRIGEIGRALGERAGEGMCR
jgi:hypothetical protein